MKAIVLAAGKGKRLQSEQFNLPKVLREACGRPLISYALDNISFIPQDDTYIIVGYNKEMVIETVKGGYNFVNQEEQLGTGHAVLMAEPFLKGYSDDILVLYGDMPLFRSETYKNIISAHRQSEADCTILTAVYENPPDYGRVIRNSDGSIIDIIEKRDCSPEQLPINELNVGIHVYKADRLFNCLKKLGNNNIQKEYYLTDVPKIMLGNGLKVSSYTIDDVDETVGVNTLEDLELCESILTKRKYSLHKGEGR